MKSLLLFLLMFASATDWTQWRGPNRDGSVPTFREPKAWPERLQRVWRRDVGIGYSNAIVVGNRVYVHTRLGGNEVVAAFDLDTGNPVWKKDYPAPYKMNSAAASHGEGPKSTPAAADGRLFTLGISGVLAAWDLTTGKQIWAKDFTNQFSETWPDFGVAMSPLVDHGSLIAYVGGNKEGMLAAFDAGNGQVKWSWKGDGPAYASPIAVDLGGTHQIVTQSRDAIVGVDAGNGTLLWRVPFTTEYTQNIITPVLYKDTLIFSGINKGVFALRPKKSGAMWTTEKVWENADFPMYMSSPVIAGDYLYGMTHKKRGAYFCLDARTGAAQWTTAGRDADNAALLTAGQSLLILNAGGELLVAKQNPKAFEVVKKYTVSDSATWAAPSIAGDRILIKDTNSLALWRIE